MAVSKLIIRAACDIRVDRRKCTGKSNQLKSLHGSCAKAIKEGTLFFIPISVCVCVRACASCTLLCSNPCWCVHYVLASVKLQITFSISMYTVCVIVCLFSALSHRCTLYKFPWLLFMLYPHFHTESSLFESSINKYFPWTAAQK